VLTMLDPGGTSNSSVRAGLVATQVLGFAFARYILRLPPIVQLSEECAVAWLARTIQDYLVGPAPSSRCS
jgi:Tetracyclin repressor-like, C-terminal domain